MPRSSKLTVGRDQSVRYSQKGLLRSEDKVNQKITQRTVSELGPVNFWNREKEAKGLVMVGTWSQMLRHLWDSKSQR